MSWQCTSWALREAPAPTATARLVLIALADRCQPDGRSAWPTVDTLMAEAHTSESSVKRALKALEETGCIRRGNQKLAQWDEHGNYVPDPYRSVVWECCMNVTLEHVSEKPGRQARAERAERLESVDATDGAKGAGFRGVKMTPLENGGNKPKHRGVKMTPLDDDGQARGVTSDTSRGGASDTPIERTNTKQITLLPPTEASPRDGESRDGEEQTDTIIDASDGTGATDATTGDGTERWQDAEPEPEPATGIDARTRAERLVERLQGRRAAMGLTPRPAGPRDLDAVTRLVERLDAAGEPDTSGLMERVLDHALDNGFQAKRVDTGRRFARLFDGTGILRDPGAPHARRPHRRRRRRADRHPRPRGQAAPRPRPGPRPGLTLHRARAPGRPQNPGRTSPSARRTIEGTPRLPRLARRQLLRRQLATGAGNMTGSTKTPEHADSCPIHESMHGRSPGEGRGMNHQEDENAEAPGMGPDGMASVHDVGAYAPQTAGRGDPIPVTVAGLPLDGEVFLTGYSRRGSDGRTLSRPDGHPARFGDWKECPATVSCLLPTFQSKGKGAGTAVGIYDLKHEKDIGLQDAVAGLLVEATRCLIRGHGQYETSAVIGGPGIDVPFQGECDAPAPVLVDDCDPLDFGDRTPDKLRALIRSGRRGEIPEERLGCLYSWRDEGGAYEAVLGERPYKKRPQRAVILDRPLWEFYIGKMRDLFDNQTLGPLYLHLIDHWSDPDDSDTVEMINGLDAGTPALIDSILHDPDYPPSARYRQ